MLHLWQIYPNYKSLQLRQQISRRDWELQKVRIRGFFQWKVTQLRQFNTKKLFKDFRLMKQDSLLNTEKSKKIRERKASSFLYALVKSQSRSSSRKICGPWEVVGSNSNWIRREPKMLADLNLNSTETLFWSIRNLPSKSKRLLTGINLTTIHSLIAGESINTC